MEEKTMADIEELTSAVTGMNLEIDRIASEIKSVQMKIGALKQKLEQIDQLTAEINGSVRKRMRLPRKQQIMTF